MNGDGFGSPPWNPAEPVPEPEDIQAIRGLPAAGGASQSQGWAHLEESEWFPGVAFKPSKTGESAGDGDSRPAANGRAVPGYARTSMDLFSGKSLKDAAPGRKLPARRGKDGGSGDGQGEDAQGEDAQGKGDGKRRPRSFWREIPVLVVVALVLALVIKAFLVQAFYIPSGSMQNTLAINDRVLVNKVVYHLRPIHRGDIVVFDGTGSWVPDAVPASPNIFAKTLDEFEGLLGISHDPNIFIKRVIGLPGDHVVCCNAKGQITVNGVALNESSYLYPGNVPSAQKFNITVPQGQLWVMGDHRAISDDSRGHLGDPGGGTIPESSVIGRAFVIIWPPSQWGFLNIPATFEQPQLNASNPAAAGGNTAALQSALANGTPLQQTASPIPLALGFIGALPLTWLQRKLRTRRRRRHPKRPR